MENKGTNLYCQDYLTDPKKWGNFTFFVVYSLDTGK